MDDGWIVLGLLLELLSVPETWGWQEDSWGIGVDWGKVKQKDHQLKRFFFLNENTFRFLLELWPWGLEIPQTALFLEGHFIHVLHGEDGQDPCLEGGPASPGEVRSLGGGNPRV